MPSSGTIAFVLHRKTTAVVLSRTNPCPCHQRRRLNELLKRTLTLYSQSKRNTSQDAPEGRNCVPTHAARVRTRNCMPKISRDCGQLQAATATSNCPPLLQAMASMPLSGTRPRPCNSSSMRRSAETSGAWSDLLGQAARARGIAETSFASRPEHRCKPQLRPPQVYGTRNAGTPSKHLRVSL